jgi:Zn-finger nucleic acid-binding protein
VFIITPYNLIFLNIGIGEKCELNEIVEKKRKRFTTNFSEELKYVTRERSDLVIELEKIRKNKKEMLNLSP